MKVPAAPVVDVMLPLMKSAMILITTAMVRLTKMRRAPMATSAYMEPVEVRVERMRIAMDLSCVVMGSVLASVMGSSALRVKTVVEAGVGRYVKG